MLGLGLGVRVGALGTKFPERTNIFRKQTNKLWWRGRLQHLRGWKHIYVPSNVSASRAILGMWAPPGNFDQ